MRDWTQRMGAGMAAPVLVLVLALVLVLTLALAGVPLGRAQDAARVSATPQGGFVLQQNADLVLTDVVARDAKTGELVRGLKPSDFRVYEDGKKQKIDTFDFESVEMATPLPEATVTGLAAEPSAGPSDSGQKAVVVARPEQLRDHRLIVMFFDLTSMQPEDLDRAVEAAQTFLRTKMQPADLVALVSLGNTLNVDQDFTADKTALIGEVGAYNGTEGQGFAEGADANSNQVEDTTAYTPDESEYNDINTDRELFAFQTIAKSLEKIDEKKSLLYFSGGISRDGIENQAALRAAVNAAVRANLAIYSVDTRGLQAVLPLGDASTGSLRGQGGFTGGALTNNMNSNFATQEVMATLSTDTGGKAFFDSNDFAPAFAQVQRDTSAYYAVGYHSTDPARNGKYRRLVIKVDRPGIKLEYRQGYYAPADFQHSTREDREQELNDELASDLPATDIPVYMDAMYFRLDSRHFYMPVSLLVPGSQIPFVKGGDKDKATLDILGEVVDEVGRSVGRVRQTVKLDLDPALKARQKNIEYTTSFTLPPGKYEIKFVVRENQTGRMGSFMANVTLPDLKKAPLKMSSIILSSILAPSKQSGRQINPLVRDGQEYVPNISHVFRQNQDMHLLFEIYEPARERDPARERAVRNQPEEARPGASGRRLSPSGSPPGSKAGSGSGSGSGPGIDVLSSLELIQGSTKVYETPLVEARHINVEDRDAVAMELNVPLAKLKPGSYICQLNVIDNAAGSFAFPRFAVLVRPPNADAATQSAAGSSSGGGGAQ